ncbi:MAG TPA: bifunctional phosphopantothenoylcysteine decarboxylase/phosphopantothenate--cysteine ligase CoaBC [Solirubrobacteraceae bacterium]|jgi:phosphopantothenoylcysteine decarboxylase/phosphopantothenate--cysteine ligase|nr:bifunctional phosphopantothenoylcysteine decarboxylase/phosphopantothenate--cysteine ligase CoaBC [Solirubrobacteraceae bacterium]
MSRILLGVSGGIAAYKSLEFVRLATGAGHSLRVIQTPNSRRFVGEASFAALSGAPVLVSEFARDPRRGAFPDQAPPAHDPIGHLELVANADIFLIAPASANTIAKLANGLADNLLTSAVLAAPCPVLVAPAMNNRMYEHAATQQNLATLRERGVAVVEPGTGRLASKGEEGIGRLAEPAELLAACGRVLAPDGAPRGSGGLDGLAVLVTAGGTREPIDSVRFVGNSSSGRMGLALAAAARERGAEVTLIAANVALPAPPGVRVVAVRTAAELQAATQREFEHSEVLLMAAAVADFAPVAAPGKIKKQGRERLELVLEPTADVLSGLAAARRPGQTLVGFAAEDGPGGLENARGKLAAKGLDAVVLNDISRSDIGFDAAENEVTILTSAAGNGATASEHVPRASKEQVAGAILDAVERLREGF